jgi:hypothetical protein
MLNIGTQVTTKKTSFPNIGTVVGVVNPIVMEVQHRQYGTKPIRWDNLYPDWRKKWIFYVLLSSPAKPVTKEEIKLCQPEWNDYEIDEYFDKLPLLLVMAYPEDDLEIFE